MFPSIACIGFLNVQKFGLLAKRTQSSTKYTRILSQGKKQKLETLSPEQLQRISRNKAAALERLAGNQALPSGCGESWRAALGAELGKPYFRSVSAQHMKNN